jgi:hypothetical protein
MQRGLHIMEAKENLLKTLKEEMQLWKKE